MGVLPQQIHIAGVNPSGSISITLMISKDIIAYLEKALDLCVCRNDLASIGIDKVRFDEREIPIPGNIFAIFCYFLHIAGLPAIAKPSSCLWLLQDYTKNNTKR